MTSGIKSHLFIQIIVMITAIMMFFLLHKTLMAESLITRIPTVTKQAQSTQALPITSTTVNFTIRVPKKIILQWDRRQRKLQASTNSGILLFQTANQTQKVLPGQRIQWGLLNSPMTHKSLRQLKPYTLASP